LCIEPLFIEPPLNDPLLCIDPLPEDPLPEDPPLDVPPLIVPPFIVPPLIEREGAELGKLCAAPDAPRIVEIDVPFVAGRNDDCPGAAPSADCPVFRLGIRIGIGVL
jgi:hypothetical protein